MKTNRHPLRIVAVEEGYYDRQRRIAAEKIAKGEAKAREGWLSRFMRWITGATQGGGVRRDD